MTIAAVDPNHEDLKLLVKYLHLSDITCKVVMFYDPDLVVSYAQNNHIDALFTEAAMLGLNGFGLQAAVKAFQQDIKTVFVTATEDYLTKAKQVNAAGYLTKPVTLEKIKNALHSVKYWDRRFLISASQGGGG